MPLEVEDLVEVIFEKAKSKFKLTTMKDGKKATTKKENASLFLLTFAKICSKRFLMGNAKH